MPAGLPALLDPRAIKRLRTRFAAWWDGAAPPTDEPVSEADLFDATEAPPALPRLQAPLDPRLEALGLVWGQGRVFLGDSETDHALYAALEIDPQDTLGVFGSGMIGPLAALSEVHAGPIRAFEWRAETQPALSAGVSASPFAARVKVASCDLAAGKLPAEALDGFLSFDEFTYADGPARLAGQMVKALKPGCRAIVEWYAGKPGRDLAPAFAAAFAEPQVRDAEAVATAFTAAGSEIEAHDDITEEHLEAARLRLRAFAQNLDRPPEGGLFAMRELAWEAESWAARRGLLQAKRIQRRRLTIRRTAG